MSDTDHEQRHRDHRDHRDHRYRDTSEPAAEKIATVCNEIKQRFQTDPVTTDDENVIWDSEIYIFYYSVVDRNNAIFMK